MRSKLLASAAAALVGGIASPASATTYAQYTAVYAGTGYQTSCVLAPCSSTMPGPFTATVIFTAQDTEMQGVMVSPSIPHIVLIDTGAHTEVRPTGLSTSRTSSSYGERYTITATVDPASVGTGALPYFTTANLTGGAYDYTFITSTGIGVFGTGQIVSISTLFSDRPFSTPLGAQVGIPLASPAPEPATWAMMLVGFGVAGAALRRRAKVRHTDSIA